MNKRIKVIQEDKMAIIAKEEASVIKLSKTDTANHKFCDLQICGQLFDVVPYRNDQSASATLNTIYDQLADCLKAIEKFVYNDTTPHGVLVIDLTEQREVVAKPYAIVKIHKQRDGEIKEPKGAGDFIKHVASSVTDVYSVRVDTSDYVAKSKIISSAELENTALDMLMKALDMDVFNLNIEDIYVDGVYDGKYKTTYASWRYED